jgi:hypothetical protein
LIRGTVTDEVQHLSDTFNQILIEGSDQPPLGTSLTDFITGLASGLRLLLNVLVHSKESFEEVTEALFQVLIQKDASSNQTPANAETIASLRIGFGVCLGLVRAWVTTMGDLEEGTTLIVNGRSPNESKMFNLFIQTESQTTAHTRFCVTSQGSIGLVPDRTEVGDVVASFDGSSNQFVFRSAGQEEGKENHDIESYRLVGSGYLRRLTTGGSRSDELEKSQDIRLV